MTTIRKKISRTEIKEVIDALNNGNYSDEVAFLTRDKLRSLIEEDLGDGNNNFLLTRTLLTKLGSPFRRSLFAELATNKIGGFGLERVVKMATAPMTEYEIEVFETSDLKEYISHIFGDDFVNDIIFVRDSLLNNVGAPSEVDTAVLEWIKTVMMKEYAAKPYWVNSKLNDSKESIKCSNWSKNGNSDEFYKRHQEKLDEARDLIDSVYNDYYGDENIYRPAILDDIEDEIDLVSDTMVIPKRIVSYKYDATVEPNRTFGPLNSFVDSECSNEKCYLDGCRMLTCTCHLEEGQEKWFRGACDFCEKIIKNISYAVRIPEKEGGWNGCFCSVDCLERVAPRSFKLDDLQDNLRFSGVMDRLKL